MNASTWSSIDKAQPKQNLFFNSRNQDNMKLINPHYFRLQNQPGNQNLKQQNTNRSRPKNPQIKTLIQFGPLQPKQGKNQINRQPTIFSFKHHSVRASATNQPNLNLQRKPNQHPYLEEEPKSTSTQLAKSQ